MPHCTGHTLSTQAGVQPKLHSNVVFASYGSNTKSLLIWSCGDNPGLQGILTSGICGMPGHCPREQFAAGGCARHQPSCTCRPWGASACEASMVRSLWPSVICLSF